MADRVGFGIASYSTDKYDVCLEILYEILPAAPLKYILNTGEMPAYRLSDVLHVEVKVFEALQKMSV